MKDPLGQITETFGVDELRHALFHNFEFALRFELGGEVFGNIQRPIPRFLQAFERARSVASHLFPATFRGRLISAVYGYPNPNWKRLLPRLRDAGFKRDQFRHLGSRLQPYDDPSDKDFYGHDQYRHWYECQPTDSHILDEALWLSITQEMPVEPSIGSTSTYLVDFERGVVLHIYDDRGMDIIATTREPLLPIYDHFHDWLLDHDIERMRETFSVP